MVVIRLARTGSKKNPFYHVVVADRRKPRDGRYIEQVGLYNPMARGKATVLELNQERINHWMSQGAKPSERVLHLMKQLKMTDTSKIEATPTRAEARKAQAEESKKAATKQKAAEAKAAKEAEKAAAEEQPAEEAKAVEKPVEEVKAEEKAEESEKEEAKAEETKTEENPEAKKEPEEEK